jgi:hypothetical protein
MLASAIPVAARAGGGGSFGPAGYVLVAFVAVALVLSLLRLRRGGPGPAVRYVPRRLRGRLNSVYRRAGWQEPYDDSEGDRRSDRSAL